MVFRWKLKCKKLERDLDRIRHGASHVTERNEQLIKELEVARTQAHSGTQHIEHIKREFAELLVCYISSQSGGKCNFYKGWVAIPESGWKGLHL